jgi:hypothetical protein
MAFVLSKAPQTTAAGTSACAINPTVYYATIPNGSLSVVARCATCHISTNPQNPLLFPFGTDYESQMPVLNLGAGGEAHPWTPTLAFLDSSGTGYTNGEKLQDPTGIWQYNTPNPGISTWVVDPHDSTAVPFQPTLNAFSITNGATYQGTVDVTVGLTTQIGARKVVTMGAIDRRR